VKSNIGMDKGCEYKTNATVEVSGDQTTLKDGETLECDRIIRHTLSRTAIVTKNKITLNVERQGNPEFKETENSFTLNCAWIPAPATEPKVAEPKKATP
jgi:hypothetical protein